MGEHATLAPSASKRWLNCPGSIRMSEGIEDVPSPAAVEGTLAHFLAEMALKNGTDATKLNDSPALGAIVPAIDPGLEINQEMINGVQLYIDVINKEHKPGMIYEIEKPFDLSWLCPDVWGTADAVLGEEFGLLKVPDLKYGAGVVVEPEWNPQQMIYALGAIGEGNPHMYEEVEIIIVQPRIPHPEGPVRRWRISVAGLFAWADKELVKGAKATNDPNAPLCSGEWCQFCPAIGECPEVVLEAAKSAQIEFDVLTPVGEVVTDITLPDESKMSPMEIARVLDFSSILTAWVKGVKARALSYLESGVEIPGYKLVAGKSRRRWANEEEVKRALGPLFAEHIFTESVLKSPAQMEKLVGYNKEAYSYLWEKPNAGNTIAPVTDKRREVSSSAETDFTVIGDDSEDFLL